MRASKKTHLKVFGSQKETIKVSFRSEPSPPRLAAASSSGLKTERKDLNQREEKSETFLASNIQKSEILGRFS